jgi:hypothetical protein
MKPSQLFVFFAAAASVALLATTSARAAPGTVAGLNGSWIATGSFGKIVVRLRGSGSVYRGTYARFRPGATKPSGAVSHVLARVDNADGALQVTLVFSPSKSAFCALRGGRLYCQTGPTGTTIFVHT